MLLPIRDSQRLLFRHKTCYKNVGQSFAETFFLFPLQLNWTNQTGMVGSYSAFSLCGGTIGHDVGGKV